MTQNPPIALTIAGSDSSGGAGIQADLKTFTALGVYGASVVTALTAQNTQGVHGIEAVTPAFVVAQMDAVLCDLDVGAAKTGMLATGPLVTAVSDRLAAQRRERAGLALVVDPVMVATSGDVLLAPDAIEAVRARLIPLADIVTPNLPEAATLLGTAPATDDQQMVEQGRAILALGARAVLIKGGHGEGEKALDMLIEAEAVTPFALPRLETRNTHGTGCTLAAAIAALRARGVPLPEAVKRAKDFVWRAIRSGAGLQLGRGSGPIDHMYAIRTAPDPA